MLCRERLRYSKLAWPLLPAASPQGSVVLWDEHRPLVDDECDSRLLRFVRSSSLLHNVFYALHESPVASPNDTPLRIRIL